MYSDLTIQTLKKQRNFIQLTPLAGISTFSPLGSLLNMPKVVYYSGRTYVVWVKRGGDGSREGMIFYFDHAMSTCSPNYSLGIIAPNETDDHQEPSLIITNSGYLLTAEERGHQTAIRIKRSNAAGNPAAFTLLAYLGNSSATTNSDINSAFGYPKFWKAGNGDIYCYVRDRYQWISYWKSTDEGVSWSASKTVVCTVAPAGYTPSPNFYDTAHWAYSLHCDSNSSAKFRLIIMRRYNPDATFLAPIQTLYVLETTDWVTWRNIAGTFSKNVVSVSNVTREELDANCIWLGTSTDYSDWVWCEHAWTGASGELYTISKAVGTGYKFSYSLSGTIVHKNAPFTDVDVNNNDHKYIMPSSDEVTFDVWCLVDVSGIRIRQRYRTTDKGTSWTLMETLSGDTTFDAKRLYGTYNPQDTSEIVMASTQIDNLQEAHISLTVLNKTA